MKMREKETFYFFQNKTRVKDKKTRLFKENRNFQQKNSKEEKRKTYNNVIVV